MAFFRDIFLSPSRAQTPTCWSVTQLTTHQSFWRTHIGGFRARRHEPCFIDRRPRHEQIACSARDPSIRITEGLSNARTGPDDEGRAPRAHAAFRRAHHGGGGLRDVPGRPSRHRTADRYRLLLRLRAAAHAAAGGPAGHRSENARADWIQRSLRAITTREARGA